MASIDTQERQVAVPSSPRVAPKPPLSLMGKMSHYARVFYDYRIANKPRVDYMPEDILLEVTNVCNFKCAFCVQSLANHHDIVPKTYLVPEQASILLRRLREGGVRTNVIHWTHDGEPFMNKRFHEICRVGVEHGFTHMYFATNGMLCTPDRLSTLPSEDCRYTFIIDFCHNKELFEEIRGTRESWPVIKKNIETILTDERFSHISLEVKDISSFSQKDPKVVEENFANLRSLLPASPRLKLFTKTFHNGTGFLPKKGTKAGGKYFLCPYPWTSLSITSNGDVVACCRDLQHKTVLGNLFTQSLPEIWNGAAMQNMRQKLLDEEPEEIEACKGCDMPYDTEKFSIRNVVRTIRGRLQIF